MIAKDNEIKTYEVLKHLFMFLGLKGFKSKIEGYV